MRGSWLRPAAALLLFALPGCSDDVAPMAFANPPSEMSAGEALDVSGHGCPANGPLERDQPEQLLVQLKPGDAEAPNHIGFATYEGKLAFFGTSVGETGETGDSFETSRDGSWAGSIAVPDEAVIGQQWTLTAVCLTRVQRLPDAEREQAPSDAIAVVYPITVR